MDLFNILNHPNFAGPDAGLCTGVTPATPATTTTPATPASCTATVLVNGVPTVVSTLNSNFGRVGQTIADNMGSQIGTGTSRQAQFSLKVIF